MAAGSGHRIDVAEPGHRGRNLAVPGRPEPGRLKPLALSLTAAFALLLFASSANARGTPGKFDYWVLALSWSPQYCATASKPSESQCKGEQPYGFVVHGLWPQFERGFPSNCNKAPYLPQPLIDRLMPIMPSKGLILHEWKTHGTCSGLDADAYAGKIETTYRSIRIPEAYRRVATQLSLQTSAFEETLLAANPQLKADGISLQCRGPYLSELRICFDTAGAPRACSVDLDDRCGKMLLVRPTRAAN